MAEIQMIYRKPYCEFKEMCGDTFDLKFCTQCFTEAGADMDCEGFQHPKHDSNVIPFGSCKYAKFKYVRKGINTKDYEMEEFTDDYNPHLNCMEVYIKGKGTYDCEKVVLDGKCIYNEYDDEEIV